MALEKKVIVDQIEVVENGCVQVRTCTRILENGAVLSNSFHRHVIVPGANYADEDLRVKNICAAVHTPAVVAAYKASLEQASI